MKTMILAAVAAISLGVGGAYAQGAPARYQGASAYAQGAPARYQGASAYAQGAPAGYQGAPHYGSANG